MTPKILLVEPNLTSQSAVIRALSDCDVVVASNADSAMEKVANNTSVSAVIMELSLAGHSGMEFLYEFRTYSDWAQVPIIIYSTIRLQDDVLMSNAWDKLNIQAYLYKPNASLKKLKNEIQRALAVAA
jgi:CheY-like chemotaxis protein